MNSGLSRHAWSGCEPHIVAIHKMPDTTRSRGPQQGAVLAELAIVLPIFLFAVAALLYIGFILSAQNSLTQAVSNIRLALTRGKSEIVGAAGEISEFHTWSAFGGGFGVCSSYSEPPLNGDIRRLLASPEFESTAFSSSGLYNSDVQETFSCGNSSNANMRQLPPYYLYALTYVTQTMKQSVGASLRYPCDPTLPDGGGCLHCRFLNPASDSTRNDSRGTVIWGTNICRHIYALDCPLFNTDYIGIECKYRPSSAVADLLFGFLRLIAGGSAAANSFVVTRSFFFATDYPAEDVDLTAYSSPPCAEPPPDDCPGR